MKGWVLRKMDEEFKVGVGFATLGTLCILIATFLKNYQLMWIEISIGGFLITGFLMVFNSALILFGGLVGINWDKEKFAKFIVGFSIVIFFFTSLLLLVSYIYNLVA